MRRTRGAARPAAPGCDAQLCASGARVDAAQLGPAVVAPHTHAAQPRRGRGRAWPRPAAAATVSTLSGA